MNSNVNSLLLNLLALNYFVLCGIDTLNPGDHDVSVFGTRVRIVSHPGFDRKSRYKSNKKSIWRLTLGQSCLEMEIFCFFLETSANKKCNKGDILTMKSNKSSRRYCGRKKPTQGRPVALSESLVITWRTNKAKTKRGFDCRLKCSGKISTNITLTTTTAVSENMCTVISGPAKGKPCVFPFTWLYTGITYDGCAYDPTINTAPWCSILTLNGTHQAVKGEWGYCGSGCPLSLGVTTLLPTTPPPTLAPGIAAGCRCGLPSKSSKIINGVETQVNEYRWMVGISMSWSINPGCGGALISDQYVLTAAHCCKGKFVENIDIFLGDHNWDKNSEANSFRRTVSAIYIHPMFGNPKHLNNDICLLKLSLPISFLAHPTVRPVCLPPDSTNQYENYNATLPGWGKVAGDGEVSAFLQQTDVKIFKNKECQRVFGSAYTDRMMCIGKHSQPVASACNGDSGGSLIVQNGENFDSVGIVSWVVSGCQDNKPSVMARVTSALTWIKRKTADSNYCPRI